MGAVQHHVHSLRSRSGGSSPGVCSLFCYTHLPVCRLAVSTACMHCEHQSLGDCYTKKAFNAVGATTHLRQPWTQGLLSYSSTA